MLIKMKKMRFILQIEVFERLYAPWQDQPNISVHIDFSLITYEIYLESTRHLDKTQHGYIISALM